MISEATEDAFGNEPKRCRCRLSDHVSAHDKQRRKLRPNLIRFVCIGCAFAFRCELLRQRHSDQLRDRVTTDEFGQFLKDTWVPVCQTILQEGGVYGVIQTGISGIKSAEDVFRPLYSVSCDAAQSAARFTSSKVASR